MIRKIDGTPRDWWSRRTAAEGRSPTTASDTPGSVASALSGETRAGWDPWEVWLHKTVLQKIADNGGNIPAELLD